MIEIFIQESEAFDRLSILEIKKFESRKIEEKFKLDNQVEYLERQINNAIGYDLAQKIYCSDFYTNLYNINFALFEKIDKLKEKDFSGREFNDLNYKRFTSKQELQKEFFKNELEEIKIGYDA